jgi:hypothetical protein
MQYVCRELGTEFLNITRNWYFRGFSNLLVQYLTKPYFNISDVGLADLDELHDLKCEVMIVIIQ